MPRSKSNTWDEYAANARWDAAGFRIRYISEDMKAGERMHEFRARLARDFAVSTSTIEAICGRFGLNQERKTRLADRERMRVEAYKTMVQQRDSNIQTQDPTVTMMDETINECLAEIRLKIKESPKDAEALARTFNVLLKTREDYLRAHNSSPSAEPTPSVEQMEETKRLDELEAKFGADEPHLVPVVPGGYCRDLKREQANRDKLAADQEMIDKIEAHTKQLTGAQPGKGG